ncbi:MAG: AraC family transcriptional regulator [Bacteroidota bacterium]
MLPPETFFQRAEKIVLQHLNDATFGVPELSAQLHLSPSQTYRKIKAGVGKSPSLFISHIRLREAQLLLIETDLNITEIAYQVGFLDLAYFSRCFSNFYGKTPTQVRRDAR